MTHGSVQVPAPRPDTRASSDFSVGIIAVIVVMVLLVFALMCLAALEVRNKRMHKDVFGRVIPPPIGPETTIMVAAIQVRMPCTLPCSSQWLMLH